MVKKHTSKMQRPKNVSLPLSENHRRWFYQELVVRFGEYKSPIRTVRQLADSLGIGYWDVVHIVRMDKNHTFLATDETHVWAVNRCEKIQG